MNENASSAREIIERLVKQSGITKKLAAQILHSLPDIIEEGLKKDGEVRVKGFGTFRLRWTRGRMGRNPMTGERVEIPSHNRVVFLPEQAFKEYINRDYRLLSYKIIPPAEKATLIDETFPETEIIEQNQYQYPPQPIPEPQPELKPEPEYIPQPKPENVIESEIEPKTAPPIPKRRLHWIVPLAILVIIILSLLFYFRNCHHNSQQSAVSSQQSVVDSQQSAVSSQQSVVSSQQSAGPAQKIAEPTLNSELKTPNSELSTQNSELMPVPPGNHLFQLAREVYGNPFLWVLIYKENAGKISDPDMLISGRELVIPKLEGTPDKLSKNDSLAVSEGYRLVYEFYKVQGDPRTNDFSRAMKRFMPK